MTGSTPSAPLAGAVRAEAAAWVARLHGSSRSPALEASLRLWLDADPAHARAFELATEAWEIGGGALSLRRAPDRREREPPRRASRRMAMAAMLLLAVCAGALYFGRGSPPIATAVGEQRTLTLEDGTRIALNTDSRLFVQQDATQRRVRLESGEAQFDVAKDSRRPFIVTAGNREVIALGTSFVVRHDAKGLSVTLMEGRVAVAPVSVSESIPAETLLEPGQRITFSAHRPPELDEPSIERVTAWRRGEVILDKTRLADAMEEMNRYSALKLVTDDPQVAGILVSGIFRAGDSVRFARAVGETYHLSVVQDQHRIALASAAR